MGKYATKPVNKIPTMTKRTKLLIGELLDPATKTFKKSDIVYMLFNMGFTKRQSGSHQNWSHKLLGLNYTLVDPAGSAKNKKHKVQGKAFKELKAVVESYVPVNNLIDYSDVEKDVKLEIIKDKEDEMSEQDVSNILKAIKDISVKQDDLEKLLLNYKPVMHKDVEDKLIAISVKQESLMDTLVSQNDLLLDLGARIEQLETTIPSVVDTPEVVKSGPKLSAAQIEKIECINKLKEAIAKYPEFKDNPPVLHNLTGVNTGRIKSYLKNGELD